MFRKNKLAMLVGEFLGTAALTTLVLSIKYSQLPYAFFIGLGVAFAMIALTFALRGISGAVFNPAITIGLMTVRKIRLLQGVAYIIVQLLGGYVAWLLFSYLTKLDKLPNNGVYDARILVAEVVGTFVLAFGWAAAVYQKFNVVGRAVAVGSAYMLGIMIASLGAAGLLNPAIALGAHSWGWATFVLGPVIGAVIGFNLYNLLFVETEVAEAEEAKAEAVTVIETVAVAEAVKPSRTARTPKAAGVKRPSNRTAAAKKPAAKRTTTTRRSTGGRGRNPNAV